MVGVVLGFRFENHTPFDFSGGRGALSGRARKWIGELQKRTLFSVGEYWHKQIFPRHFFTGAEQQYDYEPRTEFYKTVIKPIEGVAGGKNPNISLNLKGESMRAMVFIPPKISGTRNRVTVTMNQPPAYFRNPFIGVLPSSGDATRGGKPKVVTRQPDKVAEVTGISERDTQELREFATREMTPIIRSINRKIQKQVKQFK